MDYSAIIAAVAGATVTLTWQGVTASFRQRSTAQSRAVEAEANLDQHRDKLTFDLLQAAREEVAAARSEANELRGLQTRLRHFDEALEHIEALLAATTTGDGWEIAARHARAFLARIQGMKNAGG